MTIEARFSGINLASVKLGKKYPDRNAKLCSIISKIGEEIGTGSLIDPYSGIVQTIRLLNERPRQPQDRRASLFAANDGDIQLLAGA